MTIGGFYINFLAVIFLVLLVYDVVTGYRRGLVRQLVAVVTVVILVLVLALFSNAIKSYIHGEIVNLLYTLFILTVIAIGRHILDIFFFSAKVFSRLPIISTFDKILGGMFGVVETIILVWGLYVFIMMLDTGTFGTLIRAYASENSVLSYLYQHNYLALGIQGLTSGGLTYMLPENIRVRLK
ncbi:MAG: CvpA family protein [Lachnospiraceae bacterium]|nr:CvpA family protein [Lachnospiraceae bacterium]